MSFWEDCTTLLRKVLYSTPKGRFFHLISQKVSYSTFRYQFFYFLIQRFSTALEELTHVAKVFGQNIYSFFGHLKVTRENEK
jgi:hypothetical protein